jgi:6-phosphogluconolactonase
MKAVTKVFTTPEALAEAAAAHFDNVCHCRISETGRCAVVLAGGSSPKAMHAVLASRYQEELEWSKVFVFIGDERFVPPDHPESNYLMLTDTLLSHVPIPEENIFPYLTEGATPEEAAALYARELETFFKGPPTFDLVFLGIGEDGHTASLFPGFPQVAAPSGAWVEPVFGAPKPPPTRLTLSLGALRRARETVVLASGASKAEAVRRILKAGEPLPAGLIAPHEGALSWLLDKSAASQLEL